MNEEINQANWPAFMREYSNRNQGRTTRLGIFEKSTGATNDYWIHDGVPVVALDGYSKNGKFTVDLFFTGFTHSIDGAARIVRIAENGMDDGLDILDGQGRTTMLRFENWKPSDKV